MGKIDTITKDYMKRPVIFADVFNQFLYHGEQEILSERLVEIDTTEIALPYGTDSAVVPEQRYRDVAKLLAAMTDGKAAYCILAVENEAKINYAMPVKDGLYDFMHLAKQVAETARSHRNSPEGKSQAGADEFLSGFWKEDRLLPVVTVVVYYGADEWDGPLSLREMYADCDERILNHVVDYHINLISPSRLSEDEIDQFRTNFREIMRYIKYSKDRKKLDEIIGGDERFKHIERQAADIINAVTGVKIKYQGKEEEVDMCLAILEKEVIGVLHGFNKVGVSKETAKKYIMEEYQISEDETEKYIKEYWND